MLSEGVLNTGGRGGAWVCAHCTTAQAAGATYCTVCCFARPLDRRGIPQIFAGYNIHFNGVIPRTIPHPSHSVEWRMAERHGAICSVTFDPSVVTLLVYRIGYERSDKCCSCIQTYSSIPCVPITWLLDSLLQSRQIHPSLYRLRGVPAVANPTVRGTNLPHHQHPFYLINRDEYAIPTSFPAASHKHANAKSTSGKAADRCGGKDALPPFFDISPLQNSTVGVYEAVAACTTGAHAADTDSVNDEVEANRGKRGIELVAAQQAQNRVDRMLLTGMNFFLSPSLQTQKALIQTIEHCGGKIASVQGSLESTLRGGVTHVLYAHNDKKAEIMIVAAHLVTTNLPGLQLAESGWLEDCFLLGEVLPLRGMYVPTAKLMETLNKKFSKRNR